MSAQGHSTKSGRLGRRAGHTSCEACRAYKLRCVKQAEDEPCDRCLRSGKECRLPSAKHRKARRGRVIELARTLYGESGSSRGGSLDPDLPPELPLESVSDLAGESSQLAPASSLGRVGPPESLPQDSSDRVVLLDLPFDSVSELAGESSQLAPGDSLGRVGPLELPPQDSTNRVVLSDHSTESKLSAIELRSELMSHLIEEFFILAPFLSPVGSWAHFRSQFEQANRIPELLPNPVTQVLAVLLMARGARVTRAPGVIGHSISGSELPKGNLSVYGRRRQPLCETLADYAMKLADESGVFRVESLESIAVLMLLSIHLDHDDPQRKKSRPYRFTAAAHARAIAEETDSNQEKEELVRGPLPWVLFIYDAWYATSGGGERYVDETAESRIFQGLKYHLPTVDDLLLSLNGEEDFLYPAGLMWTSITSLLRRVDSHLKQGPRCPQIWTVTENAFMQLDDYKQRFHLLWSLLGQFVLSKRPGYKLIRHHFATTPVPRILLHYFIHRAITNWMETRSILESLSLETCATLRTLKAESDRRMGQSARELAQLFGVLLGMVQPRTGLLFSSGMILLYHTLSMWVDHLCKVPTNEDTANTTYTLAEKLKEMNWFLEALYTCSWSYADDDLAETIGKLEQSVATAQLALRCQDEL